jgi:hypothetical protein
MDNTDTQMKSPLSPYLISCTTMIIENFVGWALPKYTFKPLFLRWVAVPTLRLLILVQDISYPLPSVTNLAD